MAKEKVPSLNEIIKTSLIVVKKGRYAYLKAKKTELNGHFMVSKDGDEITIITEEANINEIEFEKDVKWFKMLEINVSVPFLAKGFIAKVTEAISSKDLNVLIVSTFSKDYAFVREETYLTAVEALKNEGFPVKIEE